MIRDHPGGSRVENDSYHAGTDGIHHIGPIVGLPSSLPAYPSCLRFVLMRTESMVTIIVNTGIVTPGLVGVLSLLQQIPHSFPNETASVRKDMEQTRAALVTMNILHNGPP